MHIIVKKNESWSKRKDELHKERKEIVEKIKPGMFSVSQMKKGTDGIMSHEEQVEKYSKWNEKNKEKMARFGEINREFKKHGDEGRVHSLDDVRNNKVIYD